MSKVRAFVLGLLLAVGSTAHAGIEVYKFDNPAQQKTFEELTHELRCLVCQNETIADSNADLAGDLRHEILVMLRKGATKKQVIHFMVARYGDFVLYKPPLQASTVLLWFGPFVIGVAGLFFLIQFIRGRATARVQSAELSAEERKRLDALLSERNGESPS